MSVIVQNKRLRKINDRGHRAIETSFTATMPTKLISVTVHFKEMPTTAEDLKIVLDPATENGVYNTTLYSADPATDSLTDICYQPGNELWLEDGDQVSVTYPNSDRVVFGLQITVEEYF